MKKTLLITGISTLLLTNIALADESTVQSNPQNPTKTIYQTPYYQWQGYMFDAHDLLNEQVKNAIAYNNFTFDGIKVGDRFKQINTINPLTKVKGKKNQYKVENAIITFNNKGNIKASSKVNAIVFQYKNQTVTETDITTAFGKANIQKNTKSKHTYTYKSRTGGNYAFTFVKSKTTKNFELTSFTIN